MATNGDLFEGITDTDYPSEPGEYIVDVYLEGGGNYDLFVIEDGIADDVAIFTLKMTIQPQGTTTSSGGVTIGTGTAPASGALLQLKENDNVGANSTKGILLPRVSLTSLSSLDALSPGLQKDEHIGLIVYNIHEDLSAPTPIQKGIYVWNGTEWEALKK